MSQWIAERARSSRVTRSLFTPTFPLMRVVGTEALRSLEIPRGFRQPWTVLLAQNQVGTKPGQIYEYNQDTSWSFVDI